MLWSGPSVSTSYPEILAQIVGEKMNYGVIQASGVTQRIYLVKRKRKTQRKNISTRIFEIFTTLATILVLEASWLILKVAWSHQMQKSHFQARLARSGRCAEVSAKVAVVLMRLVLIWSASSITAQKLLEIRTTLRYVWITRVHTDVYHVWYIGLYSVNRLTSGFVSLCMPIVFQQKVCVFFIRL